MADPDQLARWRQEFQDLYDSLMKGAGEQFEVWFEEAVMLEAEIKTHNEDIRQCVADIKKDKQCYRQLIKQLPKVEEFSAEEIEQRIGKASQLLDIAEEVATMEIRIPWKIEKLNFLLRHPSQ